MGTPESQGRALQKAELGGAELVSHGYSVCWNLCLRATAAATKNLTSLPECKPSPPTGAQVLSLLLLCRAFLSFRVVLTVAANSEELTACVCHVVCHTAAIEVLTACRRDIEESFFSKCYKRDTRESARSQRGSPDIRILRLGQLTVEWRQVGGWHSSATSGRNETVRCQADERHAKPGLRRYAAAEAQPRRHRRFLHWLAQNAITAAGTKEQLQGSGRQQRRRRGTATAADGSANSAAAAGSC